MNSFSKQFKKAILTVTFLTSGFHTFSQVGFDNPNPHPSSLIDMKSKDKGLLIPRMTTVDRTNMTNNGKTPAHSLLVYDITQNMFFVFDTIANPDKWVALNPFQAPSNTGDIITSTTGNVGIGVPAPSQKLEVNGKVKAIEFIGYGTIPVGGIIMWSGSTTALPEGWELCDGLEGRPDLKGRFIVGYDPADFDYNALEKRGPVYSDADGTSNGKNTQDAKNIKLTADQSGVPSHIHTGYTSSNGEHTHNVNSGGDHLLDNVGQIRVPKSNSDFPTGPFSIDMSSAGNHSHNVTTYSNNPSSAYLPFENRPPYFVLAFLIRVK